MLRRLLSLLVVAALAGCSSEPAPTDFSMAFAATANGTEVDCTTPVAGLGPNGNHEVGISDLRFYVSNIQFLDADGAPIPVTLDANAFQYVGDAGAVALIDLTSNTEGSCADSAISFAEGTARTNRVVTGTTLVEDVASVSFDIGVPQAVMKDVIADNTPEGAPSPLAEMHWSWATGYRHFVLNVAVDNGDGETGDGYLHIGSRDCGAEGENALQNRDACGFVNNPTVMLGSFDLVTNTVNVDLPALFALLDFVAPIYDLDTFEVIGEGPGVECHSSPMQPDCGAIFGNLGLDIDTGLGIAESNGVFAAQ